jgi:hypothetical protein
MVTLKRITPGSAFRVGLWFGIVMATIQVTIFLLFMLVVLRIPPQVFSLDFFIRIGISVLMSGLSSGVSVWFSVLVYNFISRRFGGLQLEFDYSDMAPKRKNDEFISDDDSATTV